MISHEAPPSDHRSEGSFDDAPAGQNLEGIPVIRATNNLDNEIEIAGLVHKLEAIIGPVCEKVFDQRSAYADAVENDLSPGAVGGSQINDQEPSVGDLHN